LGFLKDKKLNQKVNLKQTIFKTRLFENYVSKPKGPGNLLVIVGSGMNSGKTTVCRKLVKSFSQKGLSVAACKLTGSISPRDFDEMVSASATCVTDFSDYGFPSTYKCEENELLDLFEVMLEDTEKFNPDIIIMEIADGVLQQETHFLLTEPSFQKKVKGLVVAADSAPSALYTVNHVENLGYKVIALSGAITSSPLYVKEFEKTSAIPVISSATDTIRFGSLFNNLIKKKEHIHHSLVE
jgi:methylmalonyl-CoA mutase cobalamin-binding subunit